MTFSHSDFYKVNQKCVQAFPACSTLVKPNEFCVQAFPVRLLVKSNEFCVQVFPVLFDFSKVKRVLHSSLRCPV